MASKKKPESTLSPSLISQVMSEMGRKGGSVTGISKGFATLKPRDRVKAAKTGAAARSAKLTPERRKQIAKKAAAKRWANEQLRRALNHKAGP
jgi:hypothetical protein